MIRIFETGDLHIELNDIPVDVWLIGHTHVMFPDDFGFEYKKSGKIFNPGTHVQKKARNRTDGNCFIIELEKTTDGKKYQKKENLDSES